MTSMELTALPVIEGMKFKKMAFGGIASIMLRDKIQANVSTVFVCGRSALAGSGGVSRNSRDGPYLSAIL